LPIGHAIDDACAYAADLLKVNPPHITDEPIIEQMKKIGIEVGKSFDIGKLDPRIQRGPGDRAGRCPEADGMEAPRSWVYARRPVDRRM
jgi:hypothetical protein